MQLGDLLLELGVRHCRYKGRAQRVQAGVLAHFGPLPVIQPGPPQFAVVQAKTQRMHQVQAGPAVGAQAHEVAGIGRNLGLIESQMDHGGDCSA